MEIDLTTIILAVIGIFGAGFAGTYLTYKIDLKKTNSATKKSDIDLKQQVQDQLVLGISNELARMQSRLKNVEYDLEVMSKKYRTLLARCTCIEEQEKSQLEGE